MDSNQQRLLTLQPGNIPVYITPKVKLDPDVKYLLKNRMSVAWQELPEKVKMVVQKHLNYKFFIATPTLGAAQVRSPLSGTWHYNNGNYQIRIHPMMAAADPEGNPFSVPWLQMIMVHELYGHGIGTHRRYENVLERYADYVQAPNPWLIFNYLNKAGTKKILLESQFWCKEKQMLTAELATWVKRQLLNKNHIPYILKNSFYKETISFASEILLQFGLNATKYKDWENYTQFSWRSEETAQTIDPLWREAWINQRCLLPKYIIEESLQSLFDTFGITEITVAQYWQALQNQDQLIRSYSFKSLTEAQAEHLSIEVLNLSESFQTQRVSAFLREATNIILNPDVPTLCFCGSLIQKKSDKYCPVHNINNNFSETISCYWCNKPSNSAVHFWTMAKGVCSARACQKLAYQKSVLQNLINNNQCVVNPTQLTIFKKTVVELQTGMRIFLKLYSWQGDISEDNEYDWGFDDSYAVSNQKNYLSQSVSLITEYELRSYFLDGYLYDIRNITRTKNGPTLIVNNGATNYTTSVLLNDEDVVYGTDLLYLFK